MQEADLIEKVKVLELEIAECNRREKETENRFNDQKASFVVVRKERNDLSKGLIESKVSRIKGQSDQSSVRVLVMINRQATLLLNVYL
jgi:hypothetical protein